VKKVESLTAGWTARDHARALVPEDHAAIDATQAARALVVTRLLADGSHADLFHACLVLGRLLAENGGTPTLAAATMDGAIEETGVQGEWLVSARASLAEGYAAARIDKARVDAMRAWDFPRCAVRIDKDTMGFVAGPPDEDDDALGEWAARVAVKAVRAKVRRARVSGGEKARRVLEEALDLAGVELVPEPAPGGAPRFRLPWLRRGGA
jgi:hypothetical protein